MASVHRHQTLSLLSLSLVALLMLCIVQVPSGEAAPSGYGYRSLITVTHSSDGALSNYDIHLTVVRGSGSNGANIYLGDHAQNWPYDIRFTDDLGDPLSFWRDTSNSTQATIYVKINVPATGTTTFWIYYGKAGDTDASSRSNGTLFYEDFEGDLSKWDDSTGWSITSDGASQGSNCAISSSVGGATLDKVLPGLGRSIYSFDFLMVNSGVNYFPGHSNDTIMVSANSNGMLGYYAGYYAGFGGSLSWTTNHWYRITLTIDKPGDRYHVTLDGTDYGWITDCTYFLSSGSIGQLKHYVTDGGVLKIDNESVISWTPNEPTISVGSESSLAIDWAPSFVNNPTTSGHIGTAYSYTPSCNESVSYTLLTKPSWSSLSGGVVSGIPTASGTYGFSLMATSNAGHLDAYQNWTVTIPQQWASHFVTTPETNVTVNHLYAYVAATNDTATIVAVTLPSWAVLNNSIITGTPLIANVGNASFSIVSTGDGGLPVWQYWTVQVIGIFPEITSTPNLDGMTLSWYDYQPLVSIPCNWTVSTNAAWLVLNPFTGELSGVPGVSGFYHVELTATSSQYGTSTTQIYNMTIALGTIPEDDDNGGSDGTDTGTTGSLSLFGVTLTSMELIVIVAMMFFIILVVALATRRHR